MTTDNLTIDDIINLLIDSNALSPEKKRGAREKAQKVSEGNYLVAGQTLRVNGTTLVIIRHLDEHPVPGHYLATPDLSGIEVSSSPAFIVFHPKTKMWAERLMQNPAAVLEELQEKIRAT